MLRKVSNITKGLVSAYIVQSKLTEGQIKRLAICKECPLLRFKTILNKKFAYCGSCGCDLSAKVRVDKEECPQGKWGKIII